MPVAANDSQRPVIRAAQYVRMSTEHQRYSTDNQAQEIQKYADLHGMEIVRTFADDGKSGLNLEGRASLLRLLAEVQEGRADFTAILVYDVSRWGRFQDADESGYWEYVCKRGGVSIHYCAEQFRNDGSLPSVIIKNLKRTMAGEYSRELSVKVFAGQCRLIELGYRQGAGRFWPAATAGR
jgi:DNA invertase Pin-like site-specific DNA recombinase